MKSIRRLRYYCIRLFRIRTGAHKVSLGLVTGFLPCWFPTFGIGPVLSLALTKMLKGNLVASIVSAAIGSFVWPVLFYMNYATGRILWKTKAQTELAMAVGNVEYTETASLLQKFGKFGLEFLIGGAVNSVIFTILGYFLFRHSFMKLRPVMIRLLRRRKATG